MLHIHKNITATLAVVLLAATPAYAGDTPSEIKQRTGIGNPEAGKDKSAFCQGCHGEDGNSASGTFPKLSGQWFDYIQKQVREFQNGARVNETMTDVALSVYEFEDVFDIAAYFASQKQMMPTPIAPGDEVAIKLFKEGEKLYNEGNAEDGAFRCVKCHGLLGKGEPLNNNLFPVLGGQHKDYLVKQLLEFRDGTRENDRSGMMPRITNRLTEHEIEAIATYLSSTLPAPPAPPAPKVQKIVMEDKPISIQGTFFETDSAKLKKAADQQLNGVVEFANKRPNAQLKVIGYTDSDGSDERNLKLSIARAESVRNYLVNKGVAADRISTQGLGSANPVADNKTAEGRSQNRRVEIHSVIKEEKQVTE